MTFRSLAWVTGSLQGLITKGAGRGVSGLFIPARGLRKLGWGGPRLLSPSLPLVASSPEPVYTLWCPSQGTRTVAHLCCRDSSQWATRVPTGCAYSPALTVPLPPTTLTECPHCQELASCLGARRQGLGWVGIFQSRAQGKGQSCPHCPSPRPAGSTVGC